jgi:ElaB/YqjD/DUF883 family membrane-anchored ribosome-binding protein
MSESRHTNGAERSEGTTRIPQQLTEAGRQIRGDAQQLVTHVSEARTEVQTYVTDMVRERPLATLGVAAGIGYLLGGGLSSRLTVLALGVGTRFAMALAAREMSSWTLQSAGEGGQVPGRQQGQLGQQKQSQQQGQQGQHGRGEQSRESGGSVSGSGGSSQTH